MPSWQQNGVIMVISSSLNAFIPQRSIKAFIFSKSGFHYRRNTLSPCRC